MFEGFHNFFFLICIFYSYFQKRTYHFHDCFTVDGPPSSITTDQDKRTPTVSSLLIHIQPFPYSTIIIDTLTLVLTVIRVVYTFCHLFNILIFLNKYYGLTLKYFIKIIILNKIYVQITR